MCICKFLLAYSDKAFHSKIICGDCGAFYGRKIWHSTDEYRSVIFQCNQKFENENRCQTPTLTEDEIKQRFLTAYNDLMGNRSTVLADCELIRQMLCDTRLWLKTIDTVTVKNNGTLMFRFQNGIEI